MSVSRIALFVSLAVNVLLVGMVGGAAIADLRNQRVRAEAAVSRAPNMRAVLGALPPERAQEVRAKVIASWRDAREERRAARQARVAVMQAVGAETYDAEAVRRAFADLRAADTAVAARFQDVIVDSLATMTVQERRAVLRQLVQRRGGGALMRRAQEGETPEGEP